MLDGDPAFTMERDRAAPTFRPMYIVAKRSPISATAELLLFVCLCFFALMRLHFTIGLLLYEDIID